MNVKVITIIISLLVLAFSIPNLASAQSVQHSSASHVGPVTKVLYKTGYFEKNENGGWDEYFLDGQPRFPFREVQSTRDSVFLRNDSLQVDIELNMAKGEILASWPGQSRHMMHKITNVRNEAPEILEPPTVTSPPSTPKQPPSGVRFNEIRYQGGKLEPMGDAEWADYRNDSDAVHIYDELSYGGMTIYLYSDTSRRLYKADIQSQTLSMAENGGPMNFHAAITAMSGVSANPPSIPAEPEPQLPGTMSESEREACRAKKGKIERAGLLGHERCTIAYTDGGKPCADNSQCEGQCRAPSGKDMGDVSLGVCQMDDNPFGCHANIKNGMVEPALCVD